MKKITGLLFLFYLFSPLAFSHELITLKNFPDTTLLFKLSKDSRFDLGLNITFKPLQYAFYQSSDLSKIVVDTPQGFLMSEKIAAWMKQYENPSDLWVDALANTSIFFSANKQYGESVVINGRAGPAFRRIGGTGYYHTYDDWIKQSSDKKKLLYIGCNGNDFTFGVDLKQCSLVLSDAQKDFIIPLNRYFQKAELILMPSEDIGFTPDSKNFYLYLHWTNDQEKEINLLIWGDKTQKPITLRNYLDNGSLSLSQWSKGHSKHYLIVEQKNGKEFVTIDGKKASGDYEWVNCYDGVNDQGEWHCSAKKENKRFVIGNAQETEKLSSNEMKGLSETKKGTIEYVLPSELGSKKIIVSELRSAETQTRDSQYFIEIDQKKFGPYRYVGGIEYSPQKKHYYFSAMKEDRTIYIMDGEEGPAADEIRDLIYSQDESEWAYTIYLKGEKDKPKKMGIVHNGKLSKMTDLKNLKDFYISSMDKYFVNGNHLFSRLTLASATMIKNAYCVSQLAKMNSPKEDIYKCKISDTELFPLTSLFHAPTFSEDYRKIGFVAYKQEDELWWVVEDLGALLE